jgi:hypothetical protein
MPPRPGVGAPARPPQRRKPRLDRVETSLACLLTSLQGRKLVVELRNDTIVRGELGEVDEYLKCGGGHGMWGGRIPIYTCGMLGNGGPTSPPPPAAAQLHHDVRDGAGPHGARAGPRGARGGGNATAAIAPERTAHSPFPFAESTGHPRRAPSCSASPCNPSHSPRGRTLASLTAVPAGRPATQNTQPRGKALSRAWPR